MSKEAASRRKRFQLSAGGNRTTYRYVDVPEFIALATSTRRLVRADESRAGLAGLLDITTGERVVVDRQKLLEAKTTGPSSMVP